MSLAHRRFALTVLLAGLGLVFCEWHLVRSGRLSADSRQRELAMLEFQARKTQADREAMETSLATVTRELALLEATEGAATAGREAALRAWLKRTSRMHELFEQHPEQAIPELSLLTALDWLRLSHEADLDSESGVRKGLGAVRTAAKAKLGGPLKEALEKYTAANGQFPASVNELSAYFAVPVASAVFSRYTMKASGSLKDLIVPVSANGMLRADAVIVITELAPIDEDYDTRLSIYGTGAWGYTDWTQAEYLEGLRDARLAFARANGGILPQELAPILPFITSPAVRELFQATIAFRGDHNGSSATDASQLQPYLTSPEAKALAERTYRKK